VLLICFKSKDSLFSAFFLYFAFKFENPMFYQYIARQCDEWFRSPACTVADVIGYIEQRGMMRDAQVSAIKVFL